MDIQSQTLPMDDMEHYHPYKCTQAHIDEIILPSTLTKGLTPSHIKHHHIVTLPPPDLAFGPHTFR